MAKQFFKPQRSPRAGRFWEVKKEEKRIHSARPERSQRMVRSAPHLVLSSLHSSELQLPLAEA